MADELNINEVLDLIQQNNKNLEKKFYIPSLGSEVNVKPLTAAHLQRIVTSTVSGVFMNNLFNQTVYSLIQDCIADSELVAKLNTLDKIVILLQLRNANIKNTVDVDFPDKETLGTFVREINLEEKLEKIKAMSFNFDDQIIHVDSYQIILNYPSLDREFLLNRNFEQNYIKKIKDDDRESMKKVFGPLFMYEIMHYIKNIRIGDSSFDFYKNSVDNCLAISQKLSGNAITKIIEAVDNNFGKNITEVLQVRLNENEREFVGKIDVGPNILT